MAPALAPALVSPLDLGMAKEPILLGPQFLQVHHERSGALKGLVPVTQGLVGNGALWEDTP